MIPDREGRLMVASFLLGLGLGGLLAWQVLQ